MKQISTFLIAGFTLVSLGVNAQTYHVLATSNFSENWTDISRITANDNYGTVASVRGFLGDDAATTATAVDPQTIVVANSTIDVIANQTAPNTNISGGVGEFEIANPTIALQGSGTADYPHVVVYLNTTGTTANTFAFTIRDIDGSVDNAVQPIAVQYRVGNSGDFVNIPAGYVADASSGPSLDLLATPVSFTLPAATDNKPMVEVRIMTTNAAGSDEWLGIDDITVVKGGSTPITLYYFQAQKGSRTNEMQWQVNCLSTSVDFYVQRSFDARNFENIYHEHASQARCASAFSFSDQQPSSGSNYYRLKIVDVDGTIAYSNIALIVNGVKGKGVLSVNPNIVTSEAVLKYNSPAAESVLWIVTDMEGRTVRKFNSNVILGENKIKLNTSDLKPAQYLLKGFTGEGETQLVKFIVAK